MSYITVYKDVEVEVDINLDDYEGQFKDYFCDDCDDKCTNCIESETSLLNKIAKLEHDLFMDIADFECTKKPVTIEYLKDLYNKVKELV